MRRITLIGSGAVAVAAAATVIVTTTGPAAVAAGSPAEVQSPVSGSVSSAPGEHDPAYYVPEADAEGDVAMDISVAPGTPVHPRVAYAGEGELVLTVAEIRPGCDSGEGGDAVRINVQTNGTTVGSVSYGHLSGVTVAVGDPVSPDTEIGQVADGLPVDQRCWTGPHVHLEWVNHDDWACYIPRGVDEAIEEGQIVGQVGGDFGDDQGAVCP